MNNECERCGTIHDEDGYGYHDDGTECSNEAWIVDCDMLAKDEDINE